MAQNDAFMGKDQVLAFRSEHFKQDYHCMHPSLSIVTICNYRKCNKNYIYYNNDNDSEDDDDDDNDNDDDDGSDDDDNDDDNAVAADDDNDDGDDIFIEVNEVKFKTNTINYDYDL